MRFFNLKKKKKKLTVSINLVHCWGPRTSEEMTQHSSSNTRCFHVALVVAVGNTASMSSTFLHRNSPVLVLANHFAVEIALVFTRPTKNKNCIALITLDPNVRRVLPGVANEKKRILWLQLQQIKKKREYLVIFFFKIKYKLLPPVDRMYHVTLCTYQTFW